MNNLMITDKYKKEDLDEFVYSNPHGNIFQTTHIAEVYKRDKACKPLILVAIDEDTSKIVASLLAKIIDEKPGIFSSFSRHSTIRGGPIFMNSCDGIKAVSLLLQEYNEIIKNDVLYTRIYPLTNVEQVIPCFLENGYKYGGWKNYLIDLNRPAEEIWKQLKNDKKRGVKKAKKNGVVVKEINDRRFIPIFYELLKETYKIRGTPLEDINYFKEVYNVLTPKNMAKFFMAEYNNEYIATRLVLTYKGVIHDWHVGFKRKYAHLHPNDLLVWHILKWGSENGFRIFDFGGAGEPGDSSGWVEFKRRFGGKLVNYGRYTKIHNPKKLWFAERFFTIYRRILKNVL